MRSAWTHEELGAMLKTTREIVEQTEAEHPDARGLPPLTEDEARDLLLFGLIETAKKRALTEAECFMCGQLLAAFRMAILAQKLGRPPGRYYVISEADIEKLSSGSAL